MPSRSGADNVAFKGRGLGVNSKRIEAEERSDRRCYGEHVARQLLALLTRWQRKSIVLSDFAGPARSATRDEARRKLRNAGD